MGERNDARGSIEESRDRMSAIVEELARRATPQYLGDRLKEATVTKTKAFKDRAGSSPTAMGLLGGGIGAAAGAMIAKYMAGKKEEEIPYGRYDRYDRGFHAEPEVEVETEGTRERIVEGAKERMEDAREKVGEARERISEAGYRTKNFMGRLWDEQPLLVSAGIAVAGALAACLMPVTEKERKMVEPVRRKAAEGIQKVGEAVEEKLGTSEEEEGAARRPVTTGTGATDMPPTIH